MFEKLQINVVKKVGGVVSITYTDTYRS